MSINRNRLDRFISKACQINRKKVRLLLAQNRVIVDGIIVTDIALPIDNFSHISIDNTVIQNNKPLYIMLHKPVGVVCATKDNKHKTVMDLLTNLTSTDELKSLHIVGRLDLNTSGLVLLTNDSRWSEYLTSPQCKVEKKYRVTLQNSLNEAYIQAFAQGMYFAFEDLITKPAKLIIKSEFIAEVTLIEGRYHQIKRMFGRFNNPVIALHRKSIGDYVLDDSLKVGESKLLELSHTFVK